MRFSHNIWSVLILIVVISTAATAQSPSFKTYINPVIPGDHPDATLTRIGNDFYTTGSSFNPTPVIYHSTDLVHWEVIAQPVSASWPNYGSAAGGGCWGGHIVYYKGKYWDFFSRANTMYFVKADNPEGPWSFPTKMNNPSTLPYGLGYDNSIFIDDNDKWYLIVKNGQPNNGIVELGDNGQPTGVVYNLSWLNPDPSYPYSWAEGPVMWKYHGYYYYSFARDVAGGQKVMRSQSITDNQAAWEMLGDFFNENDPLKPGSLFTGPNHCSPVIMIDDTTFWVIHPVYAKSEWKGQGRQGLLNQVHYNASFKPTADYPVNKPFTAPRLPGSGIPWMVPKSDFFSSGKLNPEWSFLGYTPDNTHSLVERPGWLRLSPRTNNNNTVIKNDGEHNYSLITRLEFNTNSPQDEAGLRIIRGDEKKFVKLYSSIDEYGHKMIFFSFDNTKYRTENLIGNILWLKLIRTNHTIRGYYSSTGNSWTQVGGSFDISSVDSYSDFSTWAGTRQGLYVCGSTDAYFDLYIYRDAYTPIMACYPANQYGNIKTSVGILDSIHNNDWALYAGVEFGNNEYGKAADSVHITASCATEGGSAEIWLDSIDTGRKIGECFISTTGNWTTFKTFSEKVAQTRGRHDVYLKFKGSSTNRLFQMQNLQFIPEYAPQYYYSSTSSDSTIIIRLNKNIILPETPPGFCITLNNSGNDSIVHVSLNPSDSSEIILTLSEKLKNTDEITISYDSGSVFSKSGLEVISFSDNIVDNLLPGSSPRIIHVCTNVNGDSVFMQLNKKMISPVEGLNYFKITKGEQNDTIRSIALKPGDSTVIVLNIKTNIYYEDIATISYSGTVVKSVDGGVLRSFESLPVLNLATGYPPRILSSFIRSSGSLNNIITLKFDRLLLNVSDQKNYFTIKINSTSIIINNISGSWDSIRFSINSPVINTDNVTISYSGGSVSSIFKGLLPDFTDYIVQYGSPASIQNKKSDKENILIYPNPVRNELTVKSDHDFNMLLIYTIEGKLAYKKEFNKKINKTSLNLNLENGFYFLRLLNATADSWSEFIVL